MGESPQTAAPSGWTKTSLLSSSERQRRGGGLRGRKCLQEEGGHQEEDTSSAGPHHSATTSVPQQQHVHQRTLRTRRDRPPGLCVEYLQGCMLQTPFLAPPQQSERVYLKVVDLQMSADLGEGQLCPDLQQEPPGGSQAAAVLWLPLADICGNSGASQQLFTRSRFFQ